MTRRILIPDNSSKRRLNNINLTQNITKTNISDGTIDHIVENSTNLMNDSETYFTTGRPIFSIKDSQYYLYLLAYPPPPPPLH